MDRAVALRDVVGLRRPLDEATAALRAFPWDSEVELVELTTDDVRAALQALVRQRLTPDEVERWAEILEGRDDLAVARPVADVMHELANPDLEGVLTVARAQELLAALGT